MSPRREDYTVGWICALPVELAAAQEMLDEEHGDLERDPDDHDENLYTLGSIGGHNVAIVCLPAGRIGNNPAATVAAQMRATFKKMRFGLMVGIGGGVPSADTDIRLGDVVISQPHQTFAGVVQYDIGKSTSSGFERTGSLNSPPQILLAAVARVRANELRGKGRLSKHLSNLDCIPEFQRSKTKPDILFEATYDHEGGQTCDLCSANRQETRQPRESKKVAVHYGTIASGNQVIKNAAERDKVSTELGGVLCFEMEAAGLMNTFPCLVIRGICDYADSHKNKTWQAYAAGTAAACAKEVLSVIPAADVAETRPMKENTRGASKHDSEPLAGLPTKRRKIDSSDGLEDSIAEQQTVTLPSRSQVKSITEASVSLSSQEEDCLRSLSFPGQEHRYDDIYTARDTCEWLLEDPQYRAWMEKPRGLLWIKGNPGAGKSVLMKFAVKKMRERQPRELISSFFIHGQGTDLQKTPLGIFRALLNSMLCDFPTYLSKLATIFEDREKRFGGYMAERWKWSDKELQDFLTDVLTKGTQRQPVIIFVDALDECGEGPAKNLLAYFKDLMKQVELKKAQLKVCLSSRHYPILGLNTIPAIFVEERNEKDIQWYTRERLKDIQPKLKRQQIENEILLKARGGFQWVFLVTESIVDRNLAGVRAEKLLEELTSCPQTLSELYAAILGAVSEAEKRQMVKLFRWVLFAERPLSAQELRDALATDADMSCRSISELRTHESWSDTLIDFERYIKHISRGLVEFQKREIWEKYELNGEDSDLEAQLIHQSVADYLLDRFLSDAEYNQCDLQSQAGAGHFDISRSCLKYLTLREVLEGAKLPRGTLSSRFPLAPYATRFLFEHVKKVEQEGVLQHDLLSVIQWAPHSENVRKLADLWKTLDPDNAYTPIGWPFVGATAFHVLAAFGSKSAFNLFLETNDGEVDGRDSDGNTPLQLAIREGHRDIALTLLDLSTTWQLQHKEESNRSTNEGRSTRHRGNRFVDINAENNDDDTPLDIALAGKAGEIIFKLIEAGADLKYLGQETALVFYAISSRNMALLARLIEKKLNLDGAVFFALKDNSPQQDHVLEDIISELLKAGANTARSTVFEGTSGSDYEEEEEEEEEDGSRYDDDALILASRRGLTRVVNLLLSHGASATSRNKVREFPLFVATENSHEDVIQSLLKNAPSAVEMDIDGRTVLDVALDDERLDLIMLLLEGGSFSTPSPILEGFFISSITNGAVDIVEALLQTDSINVNSKDDNGRTALALAADYIDETAVKLLLGTGKVDVNAKDNEGRTPLWSAAVNGQEAVVKLLLDTGKVDVDAKDSEGWTPLQGAAVDGNEMVVKLLLSTGKVEVGTKDNEGWTPLWSAIDNEHEAVVKLLLNTGKVDVDIEDGGGQTPLLWAVEHGQEAVVKLLLDTDEVDVNREDKDGRTPLWWAVKHGHEAVVKLLLDTGKADVDAKDNEGRTPLWWAAEKGHETVVKLLLGTGKADVDAKDNEGWTPLWSAVANGYETMVNLLIETGKADVDAKDNEGRTPLWSAAANGHKTVVNLLLETGKADVGTKDYYGRTPLWSAVESGHEEVVKLLFDTGNVDVDAKDNEGWTPLWSAIENEHEEVVKLLLDTGKVDVDIEDGYRRTPLLWAVEHGQEAVVKLLLDTDKVDYNRRDKYGQTLLLLAVENGHKGVVELLLDTGNVDVNAEDNDGWTSLWSAIENEHEEVVKLLLDTGKVDVNIEDGYRRTPLLWAVEHGQEAVVKLLLDTDKVDYNRRDKDGRTPLLLAVENGYQVEVKLLLDTGKVNVDAKDNEGRTPLWLATRNGHKRIVKMLLDASKVDIDPKARGLADAAITGCKAWTRRIGQATT